MAALEQYIPDPNRILHTTQADFVNRDTLGTPIHLVQGDNQLPIIAVEMYKDGQPYAVPDGAVGNIRWKKPTPSSYYVYNPLLGVNSNRTIAYFEVTQNMTTVQGPVHAIIELIVEGQSAGSASLPIFLDKNPIQDGDLQDTNELKTLLEMVQDAADSAESAAGSAGEAETSAQAAQKSAEEAKKSEDNAKASEESSAQNAETAKQYSGNPPRISNKGTWEIWDVAQQAYVDSGKKSIATWDRAYSSIDEMNADLENMPINAIVIIRSDVEQEDNAKVYFKGLDEEWHYLADLSGMTGVGIVKQINPENPGQPGALDTYKFEWSDGRETTWVVYNGKTGPQGETGRGFAILGFYDTAEELYEAVPEPGPGDAYGVGTERPYDIYIYDAEKGWIENGPIGDIPNHIVINGGGEDLEAIPVDADLLGGHPSEYYQEAVPHIAVCQEEPEPLEPLTTDADTLEGHPAEYFVSGSEMEKLRADVDFVMVMEGLT